MPRRINLLCGRALLGAYAEGRSVVNRRVVEKAAGEVFDRVPARFTLRSLPAAGLAALVLGAAAILMVGLGHRPPMPTGSTQVQSPVGPKAAAPTSKP